MRTLQLVVVVSILSVPSLCRAEESCLWINAATAGGLLGGNITATVSRTNTHASSASTANAKSGSGPTSASALATNYGISNIDDSDCAFVLQPGSLKGELHVEVRTMSEPSKEFVPYAAGCGSKAMPLKAIGNEAVTCALSGKPGQLMEQVVGRVRDRVFVARLSTNESGVTQVLLRERARRAAEIIAGNLF
jgi:hypothetical protein